MKKGIFKLMSAAVVATALVSCADDLGFSNANKQQKSDLTATIENSFPITRMGMIETGTAPYEDAANSDWGLGWTEGDQIRVFTTKQLVYNSYELNPASANTLEGDFLLKKKELNAADIVGENLYAITDAQFVYGVSATPEGEARLTYTIPYRWNASTTQETNKAAGAVNVRKFPAPYWGIATPDDPSLAENTGMSVGTKALTAFVRVDMDKLPTGTKYVVFTTHGNAINVKNENGDEVKDGFYLAAPQPNGKDPEGFSDKLTWWAGKTGDVANAQFITDGKSEPLSGTFNTILNAEDPTKSWLTPDEGLEDNADDVTGQDKDMMYEGLGFSRLVTRDEIIIELTPNTPAVFYVPIIVRGGGTKLADDKLRYENLHVIAATKLSKYAYAYVGTEIYNFHQERFYRGQFKFLSLNFQDLGDVCPAELNKAIELANNRADRTSILNVGKLIKCNHEAHTTAKGWNLNAYPVNRINVSGEGKLVLNLKAIEDGTGAALATATGAVVTDQSTGGSPALYVTTAKAVPEGAIQDKVTINLPQNLGTTTATAEKPALLSKLPAYNVVIGSIDGRDLTKWTAYVKGSKTKCVTGHNVLADGETLKKLKDAGINVVAGLNTLNVLEGTTGDLFINQINEVEEPEILNVNIETANQIDILITNGLVESLNFASRTPSNEAYVYTTGSSAIQKVLPITAVNDNVATVATEGIPSNVSMYSYWTGAALSQKALKATSATIKANATKDYDIATVYTVAQLASVGEGKGADADDGVKYNIPHKLVKDMWLGAKTYPWIGAQATVAGFSLDGENVPLRKMAFQDQLTIAGDGPYYVDDPHMCCTTCGWQPAIYSTADPDGKTELTSLGLIRYYYNKADDDVLIENVNLSDVWFETTNGFENIGSIIGMVVAKGKFTMQNNNVTEPKFNVAGKNIGGMAGGILSNGGVTLINNNIQDTDDEAGYIKSTGSYVGGLVGALDDYGKSVINNNVVDLDGNIEGDSNVGGIAGQFSLHDESEVIGNTVDVDDILATNSFAGGIAGKIKEATKLIFGRPKLADRQTESVIADNIKAGENFAGGFAGYLTATDNVYVCEAVVDVETELSAGESYAGGLFGSTNVPGKKLISRSADIEVGTLKAAEGFAGGEIGYVEAGNVFVGSKPDAGFKDLVTDIDITKLSGAYAVGGVIGGNSSNSEIELATAKMGTEAEPANNTIDINVAGWENLKKDAPGFATYFDPAAADSKSHKAGTHSNVIGYLTGDINIIIAKDFDGTTPLMTVTDNLDSTAKENVGYKFHTDEQGNIPAGKAYWGDTNGMVGYGNASYSINGTAVIAQGTNGFNLFKTEANYE